MKKLIGYGIILMSFFVTVAWAELAGTAHPIYPPQRSMAPVFKRIMPAIVHVMNQGTVSADVPKRPDQHFLENASKKGSKLSQHRQFVSFGSGIVIEAQKGYVLTNAHVVADSQQIMVTVNDGRRYPAVKLGVDSKRDIALLKIQPENLTALPMGDSDALNVGDAVFAMGSPYQLHQTVTSGIVSALHRNQLHRVGLEGLEDCIQTDASINIGVSGGALVNDRGELVGISTAFLAGEIGDGNIGIGFAVPINTAKSVIKQILLDGEVQRGAIGVMVQTLTPDLSDAFDLKGQRGALVAQILAGSPAEKAGLRSGDIILQINDKPITISEEVYNIIGLVRLGEKVKVKFLCHKDVQEVYVLVSKCPSEVPCAQTGIKALLCGLELEEATVQNPYHGLQHAVRILDIYDDAPAVMSGLRAEDLILEVNHQPVQDMIQFDTIVQSSQKTVLLKILRDQHTLFIVLK